ncbi:MAG TPA: PD-(D/E)XK nuclease family protein [Nocardioidaceae bacterium]|nr:PD-(D/E)XK nuclease family protein [Nocardioidaceae bacterium]
MAQTITVSYSELDAFRQCGLKHALNYLQLWSRPPGEGTPLSRGSAWHEILQTHYLTIRRHRTGQDKQGNPKWIEHPNTALRTRMLTECVETVTRLHLVDQHTGEQTEQQELLAWMYQGYLDQYGIDEPWQILGVERAGSVWLLTERGGRSRFRLKYKIDLVIRDLQTNQLKVVDHKSAANFSRPAEIDIDDQFGLYNWAYWREHGQRPIAVIRSDARTQRNKGPMKLEDRFRRVQTFRSDAELENIALDAYRTAKAAYSPSRDVYSSPAPDRCTWRCDYLEAHLAARKGIAPMDTVLADFGFERRAVKHQEYTKDEGQD